MTGNLFYWEMFSGKTALVWLKKEEVMKKRFVCKVCGYVYEGEAAPEKCPVCKAPAKMFEEIKEELKLAAEHEFGVYSKTVENNENVSEEDKKFILEQLKANFTGECSEVGMYLCMARIAHREGYPEIGLYWEKAAFEGARCEIRRTSRRNARTQHEGVYRSQPQMAC